MLNCGELLTTTGIIAALYTFGNGVSDLEKQFKTAHVISSDWLRRIVFTHNISAILCWFIVASLLLFHYSPVVLFLSRFLLSLISLFIAFTLFIFICPGIIRAKFTITAKKDIEQINIKNP